MSIKLTIEDATEEALESDLKKLAARLGGAASGGGDTPPPSGGTDTPPPSGGSTTPPPVNTSPEYTLQLDGEKYYTANYNNVVGTSADPQAASYPFTPADPSAQAIEVGTAGAGMNTIRISLTTTDATKENTVAIAVGDQIVVAPVVVTQTNMNNAQIVTIHCPCGKFPMVSFYPANGHEIAMVNVLGVSVDFNPLYYNSTNRGFGTNDSRQTITQNGISTWNSNNQPEAFGPKVYYAPVVSGTSQMSQINGMPGDQYIQAAQTDVSLSAGKIFVTGVITAPIVFAGAGIDKTIISGVGISAAHGGKAALVLGVPGITVQDLTIQDFTTVNGNNCSSVRADNDGVPYSIKRVKSQNNDMGMLTFGANIESEDCEFTNNGYVDPKNGPDGRSHNIYLSDFDDSVLPNCTANFLRLKTSYARSGHELKSHFGTVNIDTGTLRSGGIGACIEMPFGGKVSVKNATLSLENFFKSANPDRRLCIHGAEVAQLGKPENPGAFWEFENVVIENPDNLDLIFFDSFLPTCKISLTNVTYKGSKVPAIQGMDPANITGSLTPAP